MVFIGGMGAHVAELKRVVATGFDGFTIRAQRAADRRLPIDAYRLGRSRGRST